MKTGSPISPAPSCRLTALQRCACGVIAISVTLVGCSVFKSNKNPAAALDKEVARTTATENRSDSDHPAPGQSAGLHDDAGNNPSKVRLDGSLSLGDTDNLAFTPVQLGQVIGELLEAGKLNSVRSLIRRYPDVSAKAILKINQLGLTTSHRRLLIDLYAEKWGQNRDAYEAMKRGVGQASTREAIARMDTFLEHLQTNQPREALDLKITQSLDPLPLLHAESLRLEAMAWLMQGKFQPCADRLTAAISILKDTQPVEAHRMMLLLGETERRAGNLDQWKDAWTEAVLAQSLLLERSNLVDPTFWKQAAFLRPIRETWPEEVTRRMRSHLASRGLNFDDDDVPESILWATIGIQSLDRHESQSAILAFKKSESTVTNHLLKNELQLQQAMAIIDSGQAGPASAILLKLSSQQGLLSDRARAILASMKLQNGSLAQGMNLLQEAIKTSSQWPAEERLRAQADYALACLMRGKENQGVELLNQLHQQFMDHGDFAQASQCLENLATYFERTENPSLYKATLKRLEALEAS